MGRHYRKKGDGLRVELVWGLLGVVSRLPLGFHRRVFRMVSWFLEKVMHYRRDEMMINLGRSFPDKNYRELKELRHRVYLHLGRIMAEALWLGGCRGRRGPKRLHRQHLVEIVNVKDMNELYDKSSSVVILCGHSGNWELFPGIFQMNYDPDHPWHASEKDYAILHKKLRSHLWERIMDRTRGAVLYPMGFDKYLESDTILRYVLEHRQDKLIYLFPTDQFPYRGAARHDVGTFMHQPTLTMTGGAAVAAKLGMSVVYARWRSVARDRYTMEFVPITDNAKGMDPVDIMKRYYALLQADLEEQPWLYLWTHKRWKK